MVVLTNETNNKTIFGFVTYALQVQEFDPLKFNGQMFTVNLGSVEEAMNSTGIQEKDLITSEIVMSVLTNATASVRIPSDLIHEMGYTDNNCQVESLNSSQHRLGYSVFLSDILFQSLTQSQYRVGSIIISVRLKCLESNLTMPIQTTFRTDSQVNITLRL